MHDIMKRIDEAIELSGLTPMEFCRKVGIPSNTYYGWRNTEKTPRADQLVKIADALHMSVEELARGKKDIFKSIDLDLNQKLDVLARHLEKLPKKDRDLIYDHFADTLDIYLASIDTDKMNKNE